MTFTEVMKELEKLGTAQTRKTYMRHGGGKKMFGVSFANLYKMQKRIKKDHELARQLWSTCNLDAQWLATMIADPAKMNSKEADEWARDSKHHEHLLGGHLAGVVALSGCADKKMRAWMKSKQEYTKATGYNLLGARLKNGDGTLTDDDCRKFLATIEKEIHASPNQARYSMNSAVIGIGIYRRALTEESLLAAKRIGRVEVDHGNTDCQTPEAVSYIKKALARKKSGANASPREAQARQRAASRKGRSHQEMSGANASPVGRSHQEKK